MASMRARNAVVALLVLVIGGGAAYGLLVGKPGPEPEVAPESSPPRVDVIVVEPSERSLSVVTQGTVRPVREIKLVAQVGGRVEKVAPRFAVGSFFAAGEELVKIEDVDYTFAIARAESQVAAAQQRLAEERGRARQAKREWRELGSVEANALFLRKPQIASAEAALAASRADLAAAKLDLARTSVSAPFNGRISEKAVDIGQFVAAGTPVATVYSTDAVEVRLPLTGRQVALLDLPLSYNNTPVTNSDGAAVTLRARFANRDWEWQGRIVRTDASIDENSRVVYAVAEVAEPFARDEGSERPPLAPGLFVNATITGRSLSAVVQLPRSALRSDDAVLLADADQRVTRQAVQVLDSNAESVWVQGLQQGQRVIVREPSLLMLGMEVSVNPAGDLAGGGY